MSLIVGAPSHMIECVVDSLHNARGRPLGGGRESKRHKRLQIPSHIYYPIKLPPLAPSSHVPSAININVNQGIEAQAYIRCTMSGKLLNGL